MKMRTFFTVSVSTLGISIAMGRKTGLMGLRVVNGSQYGMVDGVYGCNGTTTETSKSRDRSNERQKSILTDDSEFYKYDVSKLCNLRYGRIILLPW